MTNKEAIEMIASIGKYLSSGNPIWKTEPVKEATDMAIEALSAEARPTGEWIPVSERLPNIGDTFLVTVMVGTRIKTDVASNFGSYIDGFWDTFNDWIEDEECHVTAWMPLPEPYKGGDSEMTREQAVKWVKFVHDVLYEHKDEEIREALRMAIEALSAEAVQGEWIDIDNYYRMATCSHCLKVTMFEKWGEYTRPYNFCPNCGAKMRGGK